MIKLTRIRLCFKESSINSKREFEIDTVDIYIKKSQIGAIIVVPTKHIVNEAWQTTEIVNYCEDNNIHHTCRIAGKCIDIDNIIVDETVEKLIESI